MATVNGKEVFNEYEEPAKWECTFLNGEVFTWKYLEGTFGHQEYPTESQSAPQWSGHGRGIGYEDSYDDQEDEHEENRGREKENKKG